MPDRLSGSLPRRLPLTTIAVLLITATVTGLQLIFPGELSALRRNPEALEAGEWWRIISPLLVHSDGWLQIAVNLLGIAVVGVTVERLFGGVRFLMLYLGAGLAGEIAGYRWDPHGAGASVALLGLVGGLVALSLFERRPQGRLVSWIYALYLIAALTGAAIAGMWFGAVLTVLAVGTFMLLSKRNDPAQPATWLVGICGIAGAGVLTVLRDIHGPALLVGIGLAAIMCWSAHRHLMIPAGVSRHHASS